MCANESIQGFALYTGILPNFKCRSATHDDRRKAIGEEVARLLAAEFIKEVFHPEWVANPVLVPKKTGELRMCIDFTGLNKHCPKDPFALPRIDQIIDSTAGSELLCLIGRAHV